MTNPLLINHTLPPFTQIKPCHVVEAITHVLTENRTQLATLLKNDSYTWDNLVIPYTDMYDRLERTWSAVSHLQAVADTDELRNAYNESLPLLSAYETEIGQNKELYQAFKQLRDSQEYAQLDPVQQRIINNELRDFHLMGIDLPKEKQTRFTEIKLALSEKSAKFSENVLDATHAWSKYISEEEKELLAGLPESVLAVGQQNAAQQDKKGWLFTLDLSCYIPIVSYADNAELRQEFYTAYTTRASDQDSFGGKWDNSQLMHELVTLRHERAGLLGLSNHAEYSLATKMADSPQHVFDFLTELAEKSKPVAEKEFSELKAFAKEHYDISELHAWDVLYYSEKLRHHCYDISQEDVRPYFALPNVLQGLFTIVQRLFNMVIKPHEGNVEKWHDDVQFFDIYDINNTLRGQFYLDLYARKGKRGGAWMGDCIGRKVDETGVRTPVAFVNCNFMPPVGDQPALLTHSDVETLFHEFGHGLHHMLTQVDHGLVAGISGVAWDAVELPSQFLENWTWEKEALDLFAHHYETGEKLPDALYQRMIAAKNFQAGMATVRQLEFALFDFTIHAHYQQDIDIEATLDKVRQQVAVIYPPKNNRFANSFGHIFSGGYSAGYYSYKWAEVLSADAFSKFEERGIFDSQTGQEFLTHILEKGGSADPMALFVAFRGREPQIDALLRHSGIVTETTM